MTTSPVRAARHGNGNGNSNQMGSSSYGYREREPSPGKGNAHDGEHDHDHEMGHGEEHHDVDIDDQEDADMEGDAALIAQTLNADGTPKRPMNAFMIFARRRRPQVSAANQMMRTGEISKILSREWGGMAMSEKQFYLDQAKKLKDAFNNKYPDYVYRRRPNNSRRRRRADSGSGSLPGGVRQPGSGPLSASDHSEHELEAHEREEHASFDSGSPVDYRSGMGHLGYQDIVVHPATSAGPPSGTHPALSLGGLHSLPLGGGTGPGQSTGGLAPPGAYGRAAFTPLSTSPSSGTGTSGGSGPEHQPVSPLSPYARYSPYSPITPATSAASGFTSGAGAGSYGHPGSAHSYSEDNFGHTSANGAGDGSGAHAPPRLSMPDWPSEPSHHSAQQHSAYSHSPADPSPHAGLWGGSRSGSGTGSGAGNVGSSWSLSGLSATNLPPPSGSASARARLGSGGGGGLGLNLSLGTSSASALGQSQGQGPGHAQSHNQAPGRSKEYKELFNAPSTSGQGSVGRERAWSTTPSNASASPGAGGARAQFPTLTEPFHPSQQHQHNRSASSTGSSPSVGFTRSGGGSGGGTGDLGDMYDSSQSQPHSAYPISPISPYPHGGHQNNSQGQNHGQSQGRPTLLHPIATFGAGAGNLSPRDVSPLSAVSPHSAVSQSHAGSGAYWGDRMAER